MVQALGRDAFLAVLCGDDFEPEDTPVASIAPRADGLALFAATLGQAVSDEIDALFANGDFALGAMLDTLASEAAEVAVARLEGWFAGEVAAGRSPAGAAHRAPPGTEGGGTLVLAYSPGYCGWPVTGQRRLFAALDPADIGVTLTSSCLMRPLKSVSGVVVAAPLAAHDPGRGFTCCATCATETCRARIDRARREVTHGAPRTDQSRPAER